nr:MAG TPA: hypothetical protein [Caudoviricetes sp.]
MSINYYHLQTTYIASYLLSHLHQYISLIPYNQYLVLYDIFLYHHY